MRSARSFCFALTALVVLAGCNDPPEGVFACTVDSECPESYVCRAGEGTGSTTYCYASSVMVMEDAGVLDDAGVGVSDDAGPCTLCGMECADLATDDMHCGSCDLVCTGGRACRAGACIFASESPTEAFVPTEDTVLPSGVYHFTRIQIPSTVTVRVSGEGVLDLRSEGDAVIAGRLLADGGDGGDGVSFSHTIEDMNGMGGGDGGSTATATAGAYGDGDCASGGADGVGAPGGEPSDGVTCHGVIAGSNGGGGGGSFGYPGGGGGGFAGGGGGGSYAASGGRGGSFDGGSGGSGGGFNVECPAAAPPSCGAGLGGGGEGVYAGGDGAHATLCADGGDGLDFGSGGGGGGAIGEDAAEDLRVLRTFRPGSSGGGGGGESWRGSDSGNGGGGGGGGGAIRISSETRVHVAATGLVSASGGDGGSAVTGAGGGGGGSGGVVYLSAPVVDVRGTVRASRGEGGDSGGCGCNGGAGGIGRIRISATPTECTLEGEFDPPLAGPNRCEISTSDAAGTVFVTEWPL